MQKVDKGIPFPAIGKSGRPAKHPFSQMEIGDSAFFPGATTKPSGPNGKPYRAASSYGRWSGRKFIARSVTEDGVDGLRIWRVE